MTSTQTKIKQLLALVDTKDVSKWENEFIKNLKGYLPPGGMVEALSDKQLEKIEQIWSKHFA